MLVIVPAILYFSRDGISLQYSIISGVFGALAALLLYTCRFLVFAPKRVECSERGLRLEFRSGKIAQIAWAEVSDASFASIYGLRWKFRTTSSTLRLGGDGFSGMHFDVRAVPADEFTAWIAATRNTGPTLDAASYAALAKQSMNTAPFTFGAVDPGLFHDIVTQKLPPGPGPQSGRPDRTVSPRTEH